LSDVVTYLRTQPAIDSEVPRVTLGPLGKMLIATGKLPLAADLITTHNATHVVYPPPTAATVAFGKHLANSCMGCHQPNSAGGRILGGDPGWPTAKNLTPPPGALGKWTLEQFKSTLRTGKRPDGSALKPPMDGMAKFANSMSDVELEALWMFLQ